jgi:TolB-like protein
VKRVGFAAVTALVLASGAGVEAQDAPVPVAILPFAGPAAPQAEQRLRVAFGRRTEVQVIGRPATRRAVAAAPVLHTDAHHAELARSLEATALVQGQIQREGGRFVLQVQVREGRSGAVVREVTWRDAQAGRVTLKLLRTAWSQLGDAILDARPPKTAQRAAAMPATPPETERPPRPDSAVSEAATPEPVSDEGTRRPPAFHLATGFYLTSRRFAYRDDLFGTLSGYRLGAAPAFGLDAQWYPGAHFTDGALANLGLHLRWVRAFGLQSRPSVDTDGSRYDTRFGRIEGGARARLPLEAAELFAELGFGAQRFQVSLPEQSSVTLPNVHYRYARVEAGLGYRLSTALRLDLAGAYLRPFGLGELGSEEWFPRTTGHGVDLRGALALHVAAGLEVRLALELRRMFFAMNPEPGDPWVAGGAVDQVWMAGAELGYRFGP